MANPDSDRRRAAISGGLLSFFLPGVGQVRAGAWPDGLRLAAASLLAGAVTLSLTHLSPSPWALAGALVLALTSIVLINTRAAVDAYRKIRTGARPGPRAWWRSTWFAAAAMIAATQLLVAVLPIGWRSFSIPSTSNIPTLRVGDYIEVRVQTGGLPERGDMVVFRLPRDPKIDYVKRVIGLPGDTVQMRAGRLFLNGTEVARTATGETETGNAFIYRETLPGGRSYAIAKTTDDGPLNNTAEFRVPAGHVFAMGDSRDNSLDSRVLSAVGFIPLANLIGRAEIIYWSADWSRFFLRVE